MRFKIFFLICATISLTSCAAPEFPKGPICTSVWNGSLEQSYGYCAEWSNQSEGARISAEDLFKSKYIAVDPEYFTKIMLWKTDMESYVKTHCN